MRRRLKLDTATGESDLGWALVQLFFLMALLTARSATSSDAATASSGGAGRPLVLSVDFSGSVLVQDSGELDAPTGDPLSWLADACLAPRAVVLQCPPSLSHGECRSTLDRLLLAGPGCSYSY